MAGGSGEGGGVAFGGELMGSTVCSLALAARMSYRWNTPVHENQRLHTVSILSKEVGETPYDTRK